MEALVSRLCEVADTLRLKCHDNPYLDDLFELAEEIQKIAEELEEME